MSNRFPCLQKEHRQGSAHRFTLHLFVAYTASPSFVGKPKAQQMRKAVETIHGDVWSDWQGSPLSQTRAMQSDPEDWPSTGDGHG